MPYGSEIQETKGIRKGKLCRLNKNTLSNCKILFLVIAITIVRMTSSMTL